MPHADPRWQRRTRAVSAGRPDREPAAPLNTPVVFSSNFHADGDLAYGREGNPTWSALEDAVASLEGGTGGVAVSSGMAATRLILGLVPPRGVVVAPEQGYSGTRALVTEGEATGRFSVRRVDTTDADAVAAACRGADLLVVESPANPMLHLTDIRASTAAARETGALAVVDNTFCTPLLQQPLDLGADAVVHSSTKFLSGHSDVLGGIIVSGDDDLLERLRRARELAGCVPSAMDAFLILRGLRTLDVRLARAQENAQDLAQRLAQRADISAVHYPGLAHHPQRALVRRQMSGPGAMLSITLAGSAERAEAVASTTRLWTHATSLGGVESLLERRSRWPFEHPDVPPSLLRLSVGIEDVDDLWTDLADALDANPA